MGILRSTATIADPAAPVLYIEANRTSGVAPAGFIFRARTGGFGLKLHEYFLRPRVRWTFGDPTSTFTRLAANMPWGLGANVSFGPVAAHTFAPTAADFAAAGSDTINYTVTCEVTYFGGISISETVTVTVTNPDVAYADGDTFIVDSSGNFADGLALHPGAQTFTSLNAATSAMSGDTRILLARGGTYTSGNGLNGSSCQLGAYGNGPAPVINGTGLVVGNGMSGDCAIFGLDLIGPYDPTVPTSGGVPHGIDVKGKAKSGRHTTIHDVSVRGHDRSFTFEGQRFHNVISNCFATDWQDFGVFQGNVGWMGIVGTTLQQNPLTRNGPGKYASAYANHGPMRLSRVLNGTPVVVNNCDVASFNDWSISASKYSVQPPFRVNNGGDPDLPALCLTQIRALGAQMGLPATNSYSASFPIQAVIDKIYHIKWGQGGVHLGASFGGCRFSNIISVEFDSDWASGGVFRSGPGGYENTGDYAARYPEYLGYPDENGEINVVQEFVGITIIKLGTAPNVDPANDPIEMVAYSNNDLYPAAPTTRNPGSVTLGGVLIHAPSWGLTQPLRTDDPLSSYAALPVGALREQQALNTAYALPLSVLASYAPTAAVNAQPGDLLPVDDFFGNIRPETGASAGAIEFAA